MTAVHRLPDFRRSHVRTKLRQIMLAETTARPYQPVPALYPAKTMMGTCHAAHIAPDRTAVAVNEYRFANSGTRNPRHPISSPKVVAQFWITPTVATTRKCRAMPTPLEIGPRPKNAV